jgi:hypothetical protein
MALQANDPIRDRSGTRLAIGDSQGSECPARRAHRVPHAHGRPGTHTRLLHAQPATGNLGRVRHQSCADARSTDTTGPGTGVRQSFNLADCSKDRVLARTSDVPAKVLVGHRSGRSRRTRYATRMIPSRRRCDRRTCKRWTHSPAQVPLGAAQLSESLKTNHQFGEEHSSGCFQSTIACQSARPLIGQPICVTPSCGN